MIPPDNEAEYVALRRILQLSERTSTFTLVTCNSPRLRERLYERLRTDGRRFVEARLEVGVKDPVAEVQRLTGPAEPDVALFVTGLDYLLAESSPDADALLGVMNRSRERWRDAFPARPLVFWLSQHTATRVLTHAPDFRAWISHELEFTEPDDIPRRAPESRLNSKTYSWLKNLPEEAKRQRLSELEKRLGEEPPEPALFQEWARAWDERLSLLESLGEYTQVERFVPVLLKAYAAFADAAGFWAMETRDHLVNLLMLRGNYDEALHVLREEQLPRCRLLEDESSLAVEQGKVADILELRGEHDEALRIRSEEQLPAFEKLGDVRSVAWTRGRIADLLKLRGEHDEALRIRREEELPVFEKLGDVWAVAVTRGKIADILQMRGEHDEALRIRREEELPVFEKLGDVRAGAVTRGKIADILQMRGEHDEALRIRREEELPVFEKLGDVRAVAMTRGKIANIRAELGHLDAALKIFREEVVPVFEKLGDVRSLVHCRMAMSRLLIMRGRRKDGPEVVSLMRQARNDALSLGLPDAGEIEKRLNQLQLPMR